MENARPTVRAMRTYLGALRRAPRSPANDQKALRNSIGSLKGYFFAVKFCAKGQTSGEIAQSVPPDDLTSIVHFRELSCAAVR